MKNYFICFLLSVLTLTSVAQNELTQRLAIGDNMPQAVWNNLSISNTAKLVILDFWSTGCISCMESFPKMEKLQKQFPDKLEIILVNPWETTSVIEERMGKLNVNRTKHNADLLVVPPALRQINGDTIYKNLFPAKTIPLHVWVNDKKSILYITQGYNATPDYVQTVLDGKKIDMTVKDDSKAEKLLQHGLLQSTLAEVPVYYSALVPYISGDAHYPDRDDSAKNIFRVIHFNLSAIELLSISFTNGMDMDFLALEMKNKEEFLRPDATRSYLMDDWSRRFCFSYEMVLPLKEKNNWQQKMQYDLNYFFGNKFGIEARMEKRKFKSLVLVQTKKGLLTTTGGEPDIKLEENLMIMTNQPFKYIWPNILNLQNMKAKKPFVNESGIDPDKHVDMKLDGDFSDINNIRKQLKKYGLDIIEAERDRDVLVIRDRAL